MSTDRQLTLAKRVARKSGEHYTYSEVVACLFDISNKRGWPEVPLDEVLEAFDVVEIENIRVASISVLAEMYPEQDDYRLGYITTEEGDFERTMASPTITRAFIEALSIECSE